MIFMSNYVQTLFLYCVISENNKMETCRQIVFIVSDSQLKKFPQNSDIWNNAPHIDFRVFSFPGATSRTLLSEIRRLRNRGELTPTSRSDKFVLIFSGNSTVSENVKGVLVTNNISKMVVVHIRVSKL